MFLWLNHIDIFYENKYLHDSEKKKRSGSLVLKRKE